MAYQYLSDIQNDMSSPKLPTDPDSSLQDNFTPDEEHSLAEDDLSRQLFTGITGFLVDTYIAEAAQQQLAAASKRDESPTSTPSEKHHHQEEPPVQESTSLNIAEPPPPAIDSQSEPSNSHASTPTIEPQPPTQETTPEDGSADLSQRPQTQTLIEQPAIKWHLSFDVKNRHGPRINQKDLFSSNEQYDSWFKTTGVMLRHIREPIILLIQHDVDFAHLSQIDRGYRCSQILTELINCAATQRFRESNINVQTQKYEDILDGNAAMKYLEAEVILLLNKERPAELSDEFVASCKEKAVRNQRDMYCTCAFIPLFTAFSIACVGERDISRTKLDAKMWTRAFSSMKRSYAAAVEGSWLARFRKDPLQWLIADWVGMSVDAKFAADVSAEERLQACHRLCADVQGKADRSRYDKTASYGILLSEDLHKVISDALRPIKEYLASQFMRSISPHAQGISSMPALAISTEPTLSPAALVTAAQKRSPSPSSSSSQSSKKRKTSFQQDRLRGGPSTLNGSKKRKGPAQKGQSAKRPRQRARPGYQPQRDALEPRYGHQEQTPSTAVTPVQYVDSRRQRLQAMLGSVNPQRVLEQGANALMALFQGHEDLLGMTFSAQVLVNIFSEEALRIMRRHDLADNVAAIHHARSMTAGPNHMSPIPISARMPLSMPQMAIPQAYAPMQASSDGHLMRQPQQYPPLHVPYVMGSQGSPATEGQLDGYPMSQPRPQPHPTALMSSLTSPQACVVSQAQGSGYGMQWLQSDPATFPHVMGVHQMTEFSEGRPIRKLVRGHPGNAPLPGHFNKSSNQAEENRYPILAHQARFQNQPQQGEDLAPGHQGRVLMPSQFIEYPNGHQNGHLTPVKADKTPMRAQHQSNQVQVSNIEGLMPVAEELKVLRAQLAALRFPVFPKLDADQLWSQEETDEMERALAEQAVCIEEQKRIEARITWLESGHQAPSA